jgi:hypothetical protein
MGRRRIGEEQGRRGPACGVVLYPLFFRREGRQAMSVVFTYDISSPSWGRWVEKGGGNAFSCPIVLVGVDGMDGMEC